MAKMPDGWTLAAEHKDAIRACIKALADVCDGARSDDGAGFTGYDSEFGHKLAQLPAPYWTMPRYFAAYNLLAKYRVQLGKLGHDYTAITPGVLERRPIESAVTESLVIDVDHVPFTGDNREKLLEVVGYNPQEDSAIQVWQLPPTRDYFTITEHNPGGPEVSYYPINRTLPETVDTIANHDGTSYTPPTAPEVAARYEPKPEAPEFHAANILGPGGAIAAKLPGYEHRPEQLELAELIERAMLGETNAVTEAGTGTGKSLAYLVPAINMSYRKPYTVTREDGRTETRGYRTIVSTADKSLQAQLWGKDIPFLHSVMPKPFRAALLKGRGNYLCLYNLGKIKEEEVQATLPGDFEEVTAGETLTELPGVMAWADQTTTGDFEELPFMVAGRLRQAIAMDSEGCLSTRCPSYKTCWAERAKKIAGEADVVIVNHALLLRDLALRASSGGAVSVLPDSDYIVIDEAHHIEAIATDSFGREATETQWYRLASEWKRLTVGSPEIAGRLDEVSEEVTEAKRYGQIIETLGPNISEVFAQIVARLERAGKTQETLGDERPLIGATFEALGTIARKMGELAPYWLKDPVDREKWLKLSERLGDFAGAMQAALTEDIDSKTVRYAELSGSGRSKHATLYVKPIDVSEILRDALFESDGFRAVVATSATIATEGARPFGYWVDRVGAGDPLTLQVGSPFDYGQHALLYLPADGKGFDPTQSRQDGSVEYLDRLAAEYERLILASSGRAFALFTSFRTLNEVHRRLSMRLSRSYLVLKQGDVPRPELVRRFKEDGNAVLFGVKSFWEGVDVQGEALSLVIIDKLPFTPPDDPVWKARCDALTRKTGDRMAWFNALALPNTIIALKQGFGRLIRTKDDRGVVAILDGRLSTKPYGTRVIRALPPATPTHSQDAVRAFFGQ